MRSAVICVLVLFLAFIASAEIPSRRHPSSTSHRVDIRGDWFYVDGEPFLVKGVGYAPVRPGQVPWSASPDLRLMDRDFQRIAAAGFNTIRTWRPLPPEALELADQRGLMVLQGLWFDPSSNFSSDAAQDAILEPIRKELERLKGHDNVLAAVLGNEIAVDAVSRSGVDGVEGFLKRLAQQAKAADPARFIAHANWVPLAFLNTPAWDVAAFNVYPYFPASVSRTFGFRSYLEHLKRTRAAGKPFIVSEVGLSVSAASGNHAGYGGHSPQAQRDRLVALWDDVFQSGASGGVIFEWNDEWWKDGKNGATDAEAHDPNDPEEWFGLIEFPSKEHTEGVARPALAALTSYNQAILLSPVSGRRYQDRLPVTIYAAEGVAQVRVRVDKDKWLSATKVNRHQWKVMLPVSPQAKPGEHQLAMEAYNAARRLLTAKTRGVLIGPETPLAAVSITTDRAVIDVHTNAESVKYTIRVTDSQGAPLANYPLWKSISEPLPHEQEVASAARTDANGSISGEYLVRDPGFVTFSAAVPLDPQWPAYRIGDETTVFVRQIPVLRHLPSMWETPLPSDVAAGLRHETPAFQLADPGKERLVDYERYGRFIDAGTPAYRYEVTDWEGLSAAVGEGIYPNAGGLSRDPAFQAAKKAGKLEGNHWDFTFADDSQISFFKWASTDEEPGVKQFYTAITLERAGLWQQAVKAYQAVLVHYPMSIGWTAFDPPTPWYVGKVARDKIIAICRLHPELGMRLEDSRVVIEHGFDNDIANDVIRPSPGRMVNVVPEEVNPPAVDVSSLPKMREMGKGRVRLVQYQNAHWQLLVDGKPYLVRGLTYKPSAVGETPDEGSIKDWMKADRNANGTLDVFEAFVDTNRNDRQDPEEPTVGDFQLIRAMGVNTLRFYHTDSDPKTAKPLLRRLAQQHGFMVMMGDFVGMYTVGSGAKWEDGTNYLDATQRQRMFESVKRMVREYQDEPYVLMWVLGNENNYGGVHGIVGGVGNAGKYPKEYYGFINELAAWIHKEDPNRPVALGNGDNMFLDVIAQAAPAIDIFGANSYRGWHGFGRSMFEEVARVLGKPLLITEYGCPAFQTAQPRETAERDQALYHLGNWVDIADNVAGRGVGNAIGGVAFEWVDEWWKAGQPPRFSPTIQETHPNWAGPYPGGWNFEEWYGLTGQGDGAQSPFLRQLRASYRLYSALWKDR
ncbi:MAG: hypothetical protein HY737_02420 [Candidatus Omnitrophica bacterium]|nr:hypothetical protein [Candidatus Omnitrophota bacterium]